MKRQQIRRPRGKGGIDANEKRYVKFQETSQIMFFGEGIPNFEHSCLTTVLPQDPRDFDDPL